MQARWTWTGAHILIVEDESITAADISRRLKNLGYKVIGHVTSGQAAVQAAQNLRPDLVLMDIALKGTLDGIAAADRIREQCAIPVVYLTAHSDQATWQRAGLTGPFGYILKPFEERDLHIAIEMALQRHALEQQLAREVNLNAALAALSTALISPLSLEDISALVLDYARRLTGSTYGFVGYLDPQTGHFVSSTLTRDIWETCQVADKSIVFEKSTGLWGWILQNHQSLMTNTPAEDPRSCGTPPGHIPIHRFLGAPAMVGGTLTGMVALANPDRDYTERDLSVVERLAALYALAIQRKHTEDELDALNRELERRVIERTAQLQAAVTAERQQRALAEALRAAAAALTSTLDFDQVLDQVMECMETVVSYDAANIMLMDDHGDAYIMRGRGYAERGEAGVPSTVRLVVAETPILRRLVESGEPLAIPDVHAHPDWRETPSTRWVRSYAGAPIRSKGQVIGFFESEQRHTPFLHGGPRRAIASLCQPGRRRHRKRPPVPVAAKRQRATARRAAIQRRNAAKRLARATHPLDDDLRLH